MLDNILNNNIVKVKEEFEQLVSESLLEKFEAIKKNLPKKMTKPKSCSSDKDVNLDDYNDETQDDD